MFNHRVARACRILGRENSNLNLIFALFSRILSKGTDLVDADVAKRMALLIQQMHANMRPEVQMFATSVCRHHCTLDIVVMSPWVEFQTHYIYFACLL